MSLAAGQTFSFYEIRGPLGAGGMGEVYRARDTRLGRDVALKVLPAALRAEPERRARFLREARAVAQLGHPNIAQILDVGEAQGIDYIAFELVEGETLAQRVAGRGLELGELVELALPLADALATAHERGIVHRDLKAANVMLSARGHPKLLDFGLAKVLQEGPSERQKSTTLTLQGAIFGTPGAMSPEQALGRAVDARTDVFSFGSLLYEMACGRPAFEGSTVMEVMDAVIHREPPPLSRARPELPADFVAIVEKSLRKDAGERYQTMSDLAADLRHFKRKTDSGLVPPASAHRRGVRLGATLAVALLALAVGAWLFSRRASNTPGGASDAVAPGGAGPGYVAVMYFEDKLETPDAAALGEMLTHLVTTELARDAGLEVLSQQRLFETARRAGREDGRVDAATASEVAREAGVATMVLGRVAPVGSQLLASASVVDVRSGRELATAQARGRVVEDVFSMAEELGSTLRARLGSAPAAGEIPAAAPAVRVTSSVEAYREFLAGFRALQRLELPQAVAHLGTATELDPGFAQAYYWDAFAAGWAGETERSVRSIERAQAFRERLPPEELRTLPMADLYHRGRLVEARARLEELVAAEPENRDAWYMLGEVYVHAPADADAGLGARAFRRVLEIDPRFALVEAHYAQALLLAGERAEALAWNRVLEERDGPAESGIREAWLSVWAEDLEWAARLRAARRRPNGDEDLVRSFTGTALLQAALASGEEAAAELRDHELLANGAARLRERSSQERTVIGSMLHQLLVLEGRFDEARSLSEVLPPLSTVAGRSDYEAGTLADALLQQAQRLECLGDASGALALVEETARTIEAPRARWQAVALASELGREEAVREHVAALEALVARGALRAGYYLALARAEVDLAAGRAGEARAAFERALAPDREKQDLLASMSPPGGRILDGLLRAARFLGDGEGELALLRRIVERRMLRAWDPVVWRRAQAELGARELAAGNEAEGRALLGEFLAAWGDPGAGLPEVARARAALAVAEQR